MRAKTKKRTTKKKLFQFQNWLQQHLRRISYRFPPRKSAIIKARVARGKYRCSSCLGENFGPKDIQLDHTIPCIDPHTGFTTWDEYITRLFCDESGFSVMCRECHSVKTKRENLIRSMVKRDKIDYEDDDI